MLNQVPQYIESFRGERYASFPAPQAVVDRVEPEGMELLHWASSLLVQGQKLREEAFPRVYDNHVKITLKTISSEPALFGFASTKFSAYRTLRHRN